MANFNLNKVILGGRITGDVELRTTPSGLSVVKFGIAVNRTVGKDAEQVTDFFNATAWRGTAEFISRYFSKGSAICVCGAILTNSWTDNSGVKRYGVDLRVDEVYFVDSKGDAVPHSAAQGAGQATAQSFAPAAGQSFAPAQAVNPNFESLADNEELPF